MVSNVRTSRERPTWITETLWQTMTAYWETEEAQTRSQIYSNARMSDRNGLGPAIHVGGPTSYLEIKHRMVSNFQMFYICFVFYFAIFCHNLDFFQCF